MTNMLHIADRFVCIQKIVSDNKAFETWIISNLCNWGICKMFEHDIYLTVMMQHRRRKRRATLNLQSCYSAIVRPSVLFYRIPKLASWREQTCFVGSTLHLNRLYCVYCIFALSIGGVDGSCECRYFEMRLLLVLVHPYHSHFKMKTHATQ